MERRPVKFFSERVMLDGDLYLPDGAAKLPAIIVCSGYQGLKDIHPVRFARALVPRGYVCLAFDYRGFGMSEGERGRIAPNDQVADTRAAASLLECIPDVDSDRIGVLGWALGGGVAIGAAADDQRFKAVAAINAIGDGGRVLRALHDDESWMGLMALVAEDRRNRAWYGRSTMTEPWDIVRLDKRTREYVNAELYKAAGFGSRVTLESVDLLTSFRPDTVAHRIAPRPLLLVHGDQNELHPPTEASTIYAAAESPTKLEWLRGWGHTEWMADDHPTFLSVVEVLAEFFDGALKQDV